MHKGERDSPTLGKHEQISFVARVWNRHWRKEEKVGIRAWNMKEAVKFLNKEKGQVFSISRVNDIPGDVDSTVAASDWSSD